MPFPREPRFIKVKIHVGHSREAETLGVVWCYGWHGLYFFMGARTKKDTEDKVDGVFTTAVPNAREHQLTSR